MRAIRAGQRLARPLSLALIALAAASMGYSRQATEAPAFEVVSIKPYQPPAVYQHQPATPAIRFLPDRFSADGITLRYLIREAYHVEPYQVTGIPAGLSSERYNVECRAASPTDKDVIRGMLRRMLEERFKLVARAEVKELQVYAMSPAKDGAKLVRVPDDDSTPPSVSGGAMHLRVTMAQLAGRLSEFIQLNLHDSEKDAWVRPDAPLLPVVDETELPGIYEVALHFPLELDSGAFASWNRELQHLGLRLAPKKAPIKTIVIDHLEKPTGN